MMNLTCKQLLSWTLAALFALAMVGSAEACPTCKDALGENSANLVRGFGWSIIFMMATPFLILAGVGGYFYYEIRKARANGMFAANGVGLPHGQAASDAM